MYKAYVFDFDYTLVNSEQGIVMCFEMLLRDEGYPPGHHLQHHWQDHV